MKKRSPTSDFENAIATISAILGPAMTAAIQQTEGFCRDLEDYSNNRLTPAELHETLVDALHLARDSDAVGAEDTPPALNRKHRPYKPYVLMGAAEITDLAEHLSVALLDMNKSVQR